MFYTVNNSKSVACSITNDDGHKKVALHEVFYTISWFNISKEKRNNWISLNKKKIIIPDGYYDVCTLIKEVFEPSGFQASLNESNLHLTLTWNKTVSLEIEDQLSDMLGVKYSKHPTESAAVDNTHSPKIEQQTIVGSDPVKMSVHDQMFLYLKELQSSYNHLNNSPSYLLRPLPVSRAPYGESVHVTFSHLQYKPLTNGFINTLTPELRNKKGELVECSDLTVVLEIN